MSFIIFIIFVILLLFFFFASVVLSLLGNLFSFFRPRKREDGNDGKTYRRQEQNPGWDNRNPHNGTKDKKILFGKDEGEYVDFEEIKDGER